MLSAISSMLWSFFPNWKNIKEFVIGNTKYWIQGNPTFEKINDEMKTVRGFVMTFNIQVDDDLTNVCVNI